MSRAQIKARWGGDGAATTPNIDVQVKERSGKPLYEINITATRHMPNDVKKAEYARLWGIENKSVRCFAQSVGSVGSRMNSMVSPISNVEMGLQMVRSNIRAVVDAETLSCRFIADGIGGNKVP